MLSRIADSLFWMNRYMERCNGILRMLRINVITSLDHSTDFNWIPVLKTYTNLDEAAIVQMAGQPDAVLRYILTQRDNPNSLRSITLRARENARGVQDHITKELWECLNGFYHKINHPDVERAIDRGEQIVMLGNLLDQCMLFNGIADVTMPRGQGWHYMMLGKLIERAVQTSEILDVRFGQIDYDLNNPSEIPYLRNLLLSLSGYELYLKRYHGGLQSRNVVDLGILNPDFPRSVLYCVVRMDKVMDELAGENRDGTASLQKIIGRLRSKIAYADVDSIAEQGLHDFLIALKKDIFEFSTALSRTYFAYN
jgi:uncharacterized alpha-E superfamily protein